MKCRPQTNYLDFATEEVEQYYGAPGSRPGAGPDALPPVHRIDWKDIRRSAKRLCLNPAKAERAVRQDYANRVSGTWPNMSWAAGGAKGRETKRQRELMFGRKR